MIFHELKYKLMQALLGTPKFVVFHEFMPDMREI